MNEPAVKMEEQIINLFQEAETEVYEGWVLKTLGSRLIVFPLYNVYPDNMDERIRACERLGNENRRNVCSGLLRIQTSTCIRVWKKSIYTQGTYHCGRFVHYGGNCGSVKFGWQKKK